MRAAWISAAVSPVLIGLLALAAAVSEGRPRPAPDAAGAPLPPPAARADRGEGRAVDATGRIADFTRVSVDVQPRLPDRFRQDLDVQGLTHRGVWTDRAGNFEADRIAPGPCRVTASRWPDAGTVDVLVGPGSGTKGIEVPLRAPDFGRKPGLR